MRRTLLFIFLLFAEIVTAQSTGRTILSKQATNTGNQLAVAKTVSPFKEFLWDEAELFVNGYSRVLYNNKFSFIDHSGHLICAVEFDAARNFSNKLAAVKKDAKWGFINESGKAIIACQYEIVFDFKEKVTGVFSNGKWFLINTNGTIIKPLDITVFYGFNKGFASIEKDGITGTMNTRGEIIFDKNDIKIPVTNRMTNNRAPGPTTSTDCPDNIDFEYGSFFNWKCFLGQVDSVGNTNIITVNPSAPTNNRHTLYTRTMPSPLDPYGLFPTNPPDGSNFAVRLGNTLIGAQAERIQYPIRVPLNDSNFSIKYDYAVVFEDPGHTTWTQPRFTVRLRDSATNIYVDCASFEYISTSNLPGFARSTVDTGVVYKPWSTVFVSLRGYAGKTMFLEFTTADCVRRGHWGYAYVDVEKPCGQSVEMQYECASPNITTLDGPPGFQFYNWWDSSYTNIYASGQHVVLNPGPPVNTTIWLEMIPYNNFGCKDTIPVTITGIFNANFSMSDTVGVCAPHTFTFYNSDIPSTSAIWVFGDGSFGTGDTVTHTYTLPGTYYVYLNVLLPSGCRGVVRKTVTILQPVGTFYFNGAYFCNSQITQFDAVVNNSDSLFWDFGDGTQLATTLTTVYHTYAFPGLYMPFLTVQSSFGCQNTLPGPDTIRIEKLQVGFFETQHKNCGSTTVNFSDTSYAYFGINTYEWNFGDGTTGTGNTVSHTYTVTGTYNVQLIITGNSGCRDTVVKPLYIEVYERPVAAITGAGTQCGLSAVTFNSSIQSADPVNFIQWTSSSGSTGSGNTFTVNFALPGAYTIQLIVGTINGCYDTTVHSITINAAPDVIQPRDQELCNGATTNDINFTGSVSSTLYSWTNNNSSIGLAATGTGDIAAFTAINNTTSPVTATITVSPSANNCPGPSKTFTITVNPSPDMVQPNSQVLCSNTPTALINFTGPVNGTVYNWTNNNTSIGLAANGSGDIPSFITVNNSGAAVTATIIVSTTANGCPGPSKLFAITVNPTPDVVQPIDQALCNGAVTADINFAGSISTTLYSWTNDNPSIGLAATGTGDIAAFTVINNTAVPVTATITVSPFANNCPGLSETFTITVNPTPDLAQPNDQSLCKNELTAVIIFTGSVSGTIYNWANNNPQIGLAANGTGNIPSFTAQNNTSAAITATITVSANANGCSSPAKVFTITVNPAPDVDQPNDQELCNGATTTLINFTSAISGTTYSWVNNNTSIGLAANGTGNIAAFTAVNNTTVPVIATIIVSSSTSSCPGLSRTFNLTVNPSPAVAQPADQVLCKNDPTTTIIFTGPVNGTTYSWTNNNTLIGLAANGSGDIPTFTAINNTTQPVTATITVSANANGCSGPAKVFTITVNPLPAVTQPIDHIYCNGATTSIISFATAVSGATFNWTNDNPSIGLAATGTGDIAAFTATNNTATPVIATITVSATANVCPGPAKTFTITINPLADIVQPNDLVLCNGTVSGVINFTSTVSGTGFNWTNNNTSIGLGASGSGDIAAFTAINSSNIPITATISVMAAANGCPGQTKTFIITVNPSADVAQPLNQLLCNGSSSAAVSFTGNVSGTSFNWTNNNTAIGLGAGGSGDIAAFTAINTISVPITATITVTPVAGSCPGPDKEFTIIVNPTPDVIQVNDQTVCTGSATASVNFTGAVSGTAYNWTNNNPSIGLSVNGTGNIASFVGSNNTDTLSTAIITVSPIASGCQGPGKDFMIIVKPSPKVDQPANQALCNHAITAPISFTASLSGSTFSWTNNNTNVGLAANGTGNIPPFLALNGTDAAIIALINITASANGCIGPIKTAVITVNPTPAIVASNNTNVCLGRTVQLSATGGAQYSWSPANLLSCTNCANPVSTPVDSIRYVVEGTSAAGCKAYDSVLLSVIKPFRMAVSPGDSLCIGESTGLHAIQANTYLWSPPAGLNNVNIADPTATPQVTTTYSVVGYDAYNCFTDTGRITIIVGPRPAVEIGADISTQTGTTVTLHPQTQNGPIVSWLWTPATNLSCTDCAEPIATIKDNITYDVTVINNFGCVATDRIRINVFCKSAQVFIPNAFTPDGDGLNDILMVRGSGISVKTFRIFSRWGELVFERTNFSANDPKYGWDGKIRGVPATPDVFVYTAEVICDNGMNYIYKGNTTVLK